MGWGMSRTPAERQQALYERRKREGLVLVRAWLPRAQAEAVKLFIGRLTKRRAYAAMKKQERYETQIPKSQS